MRYQAYLLYDANCSPFELLGISTEWTKDDIQYELDMYAEEAVELGKEGFGIEAYAVDKLLKHFGDDIIVFGLDDYYNVLHIHI